MYIPKSFNETRLDVLHSLVRQHPLGTVITHDGAGLQANHIPFEIAPASDAAPFGILRAHVARANPLWQHTGDTLTVFQGPSAYVSPSLYEEKPVSGKVVPTWNYAVLHAHGRMRAVEDPAWIFALLERLTAQHESARRTPWAVADAPSQFIDQLLGAIVGIEIVIERLEGKWKMSQNRSQHDQLAMAADTGLRLAS
ncbi:FMN-binding negative transcriptional regulator [Massilia sp. CF038]|uniref:FMN-binding negative transcriptional regulator n=1 Tax=Massilia sp. CF038 TaxID=1881045 RepID=UPI000920E6E4|nr:FMN-binding negative transcriptional regulator [Massilia sp. CF038]SHH63504.1 negative transcriptional regulator, PaiB family [Massilia sp. CF038]